ncbi:MAG: VWA domain-containing protein [Acidimicrobiia bacterium]|nr:VWA domain-containing protein [Acidimicrobiia bacterium]
MRFRTALILVSCGAVLSAQQPAPRAPATPSADTQQGPPVTFRAEVNYVEVDATVTDADGNPVADLTRDDFEILEDGKPQRIESFSLVHIPIRPAEQPLFATEPIEPDVQSNQDADGRVYVIVLDSRHTDPLNGLRVKAAARKFIEERLGANDLAAVVHTSGRSDLGQDFTNNRRLLAGSIDRFVGEKMRDATLERNDAFRAGRPAMPTNPVNSTQRSIMDPFEMERAYHARQMLRMVERVSAVLEGIRGRRKALIFISEGLAYDFSNPWSTVDTTAVGDDLREAIGSATRANVSFYAIDPNGLSTDIAGAIEVDGFPGGSSSLGADGSDSVDPATGDGRDINLGSMMSDAWLSRESLRTLADQTGGYAFVNRNDFADAFDRVVRENSTYYLLGYNPTNTRRDGKFRRITVRVKRDGLSLRARRGYVAPRGRAPEPTRDTGTGGAALRGALNSPIPMAGLPMRVAAAPFKGTAPNASVALSVEMEASGFQYTEKEGLFHDAVELVVTPYGQGGDGAKPGTRTKIGLSLKPDTRDRANAHGFRALAALDVPPGRYQLRVAAAEDGSGRAGSVLYDLEIPDFFTEPFTMSGVAVTAASAREMPTVGSEGVIAPLVLAPTIATREFSRRDTLALFAEVYANMPNAPPHTLDLSTTVRDQRGVVVFQHSDARSSTELTAGRGGYGYTPQIPLEGFEPGTYVIHVQATARLSKETGVGRDILIRVR